MTWKNDMWRNGTLVPLAQKAGYAKKCTGVQRRNMHFFRNQLGP
jgi:hypothetical protein